MLNPQSSDVLSIGTVTPLGAVRGIRAIEKAEEGETHMKAGIWYIVELPNRSSLNNLRYFHERQLMEGMQPRKAI